MVEEHTYFSGKLGYTIVMHYDDLFLITMFTMTTQNDSPCHFSRYHDEITHDVY